jgi:drug/metabolite transporter (DMT)-like permease
MFKTSVDLVIFLLAGATATFGNALLKAGMNKLGTFNFNLATIFPVFFRMFTSWEILLGFFLYGLSSILYLKVLTTGEVTKVYPLSVSYMFLLLLGIGVVFLHESFTITKVAGIMVIILGIFLTSR